MSAPGIDAAQLLMPAVAWDPQRGFGAQRAMVDRALGAGVGGFLLRGGPPDDVAHLTTEVRERSRVATLLAAEPFAASSRAVQWATFDPPPPAAIESVRDSLAVRLCATVVAREARALGINCLIAPPCNVARFPDSGAFGSDAAQVADAAASWIDACRAEGVLCCASAFPGAGRAPPGGRTVPAVRAADEAIYASDLVPFRAAIDAGVAAMLLAAASYPALDASGVPAPLSPTIVRDVLRRQLEFDGLTMVDAGDLSARLGRWVSAAELIAAGADLVLAPGLVDVELRAVAEARRDGRLHDERLHDAGERRRRWAELAAPPSLSASPPRSGFADQLRAARQPVDELAERAVCVVRGRAVRIAPPLELSVVAAVDGAGIARSLTAGLGDATAGPFDVRHVAAPGGGLRTPFVVAVQPEGGEGASGVVARIEALSRASRDAARDLVVVWCGHPDQARDLTQADLVIACWSSGDTMLRAAGRWLVRRT